VQRGYALAEDPFEPGAAKHRFEVVVIDPDRARATGYVAKYVAKNIDGYQVEIDDEAALHTSISAIRAASWASVWDIWQFQPLGGPPVTVWRELKRLDKSDLESQLDAKDTADCHRLTAIH